MKTLGINMLILFFYQYNLLSQAIVLNYPTISYQISSTYEFKSGVVSLTFDDGTINQWNIALPLLESLKLPATFYIITGNIDNLQKDFLSTINPSLYEIGSHTDNHIDLKKSDKETVIEELSNSQKHIQEWCGHNAGLTLAYPWGAYNNTVKLIAKNYFLAARSTDIGFNGIRTMDRHALKMQNFDSKIDVESANEWVDFCINNNLWLIEMYHGIDGVGYSPIVSEKLKEHFNYIRNKESKIWCSTVANVIKYAIESGNTVIKCDFCNDTVYKIKIDDSLDDSLYDHPVSIRIKVPDNWETISISDNYVIKTEYVDKNKFVCFNALPDNRLITIRPESLSYLPPVSGMQLVYLSENPFFDKIKITLEVFSQSSIEIRMIDLNGKILLHKYGNYSAGLINLDFDTSDIASGIYILNITDKGSHSYIKKMMKL